MTIKKIALLLSLTLSACSILDSETTVQQNDYPENDVRPITGSSLDASLQFKNQYTQQLKTQNNAYEADQSVTLPTQNINYYVRGLMQDLVGNLQYVNSTTPVAVVSFVMLDGDYNQANLLGNQIAESLIHEIHKFGIPVIDFKTTDYIRVTPQGDFAFTRDYEEVNPSMPARYIVGGTMVKHQGGYLINARIVGIESKAVVASAQSFIPSLVTDTLLTSSENTSGEIDLADYMTFNNTSNAGTNVTNGTNLNGDKPTRVKSANSHTVSLISN
ncbi:FlgO family outer membrane protein [Paraglaciecola sp.]|uniref:FlgO family outer membrane protein n=1 Tax=Paraglaciecola sp. TaxID=1920173 RepID=UPI0030F3B89E